MNQVHIQSKNLPKLRFTTFDEEWKEKQIKGILERVSKPVDVETSISYKQIGIRSHGRGIFYKEVVLGSALGNKRVFWVEPDTFIVNIVFAWEQAVAKTTINETGMIASHRFPMYAPVAQELILDFILYFFLTQRGKYLLGLASPGGAGRNKTLGQRSFEELLITIPKKEEQEKIVNFLNKIDEKIILLQRKLTFLQKYKKGAMQQVFTQKIRFKSKNGNTFPNWQRKTFGSIYSFLKTNSLSRAELSETGIIKNIHYGDIHTRLATNFDSTREKISYLSSTSNSDYCEVGDLIIADASEDRKDIGKSIEIIKTNNDKIVAGLHTFLARPKLNEVAIGFSGYLMQIRSIREQMSRIATGATVLGISKTELSKIILTLPVREEQKEITAFFTVLDEKISLTEKSLKQAKKFKKGLLQQMFI